MSAVVSRWDGDLLIYGYINLCERECHLSTPVPNDVITLIILFSMFYHDLSMITDHFDINTIINTLRFKYSFKNKNIYSWISSSILIAINPYQSLSIYGPEVINRFYESQQHDQIPNDNPHPYGVAARSYLRMINRKCHQSIIILGESGSGKTETYKLLIKYLMSTAPSSTMNGSVIQNQTIAISSILESFGNAKTALNNNASRFSIINKLLFDVPINSNKASFVGNYLETYLLQRSRLVFQAPNERNFHIAYMLYHGIPKDQHNEYCIMPPNQYNYISNNDCIQVPGISDSAQYQQLIESFKLMRIDESLQKDIWCIVSGIFNLGNINFKREIDGFASIDPNTEKYVTRTAKLWQIDPNRLIERLTTASKLLRRKYTRKIAYDEANRCRDTMAKCLYHNLFLYLCERINAETYVVDDDDIESILFIGIVDIVGFANFEKNSLDQFCYNFANEKMQHFFCYHVIRSEQEEYIKEGKIYWTPISIPDNLECIEMIQDKNIGFFSLLDSECKAPKPDIHAFMQELFKIHGSKSVIKMIKTPQSKKGKSMKRYNGFEIKHLSDNVCYDVSEFLIKNMESNHHDTPKMMKRSKCILVQQVGGGMSSGGRRKRTVTGFFYTGIKTLMKNLCASEPFFIQCIKPNMTKSPGLWDEKLIENQLRYHAVVQAVKVLKCGYPTHIPYDTLYDRYYKNVTNPLMLQLGAEAFSVALLAAFDIDENDYELGLTKIFFKPSKAMILDVIMKEAGNALTIEQDKKITKRLIGKRVNQMIGICKAFLLLKQSVIAQGNSDKEDVVVVNKNDC